MLYPPITPARFRAALGAAQLLFDVAPRTLLGRSRSQRLTPARQAVIAALADARALGVRPSSLADNHLTDYRDWLRLTSRPTRQRRARNAADAPLHS